MLVVRVNQTQATSIVNKTHKCAAVHQVHLNRASADGLTLMKKYKKV